MMGVFVQTNLESRNANRFPIGYVIQESGCWDWVGTIQALGYGHVKVVGQRRRIYSHRYIYEEMVGPVPAGLTLDHLCHNRRCVNPAHLEPVSQRENILRGGGPTAANARKTHCKNGHEFTPENTHTRKTGRACRACLRDRRHR